MAHDVECAPLHPEAVDDGEIAKPAEQMVVRSDAIVQPAKRSRGSLETVDVGCSLERMNVLGSVDISHDIF